MPPSAGKTSSPSRNCSKSSSRPYEDRPGLERYATPARPEESVRQTFCGT